MLFERQSADNGEIREAQLWLPTCAALCVALLVFFIMLYSMTFLDPQRFARSMNSISKALGGDAGFPSSSTEGPVFEESSRAWLHKQLIEAQTRTFTDVRAFIVQNDVEAGIETALEGSSIILRLSEGMLFMPGTDVIPPSGLSTLHGLKDLFVLQAQQAIHIRSYTDDSPLPPGARFKDTWELSTLQAARILRYLLSQGIEPGRLTATGFGEFEPLFPNTTEKNRARNRRIEFVLERRFAPE